MPILIAGISDIARGSYSYSLHVFIYATYKINEQKTNKKYGHKGKNEKWPIKPTSHQKNQVPNKSVNNKQHKHK